MKIVKDIWNDTHVIDAIGKFAEVWSNNYNTFSDGQLLVGLYAEHGLKTNFQSFGQNSTAIPELILSHFRAGKPSHSAWLISCLGGHDGNIGNPHPYRGVFATKNGLVYSQGHATCFRKIAKSVSSSGIHYLEESFSPAEVGEGIILMSKWFFVCVDKSTEVKLLYCRDSDGSTRLLIDKINGHNVDLFAECNPFYKPVIPYD